MFEKKLIQYEKRLERLQATMNCCVDKNGNIIKGDLINLALSEAKELLSECKIDKSNCIETNIALKGTPTYNRCVNSFDYIIKNLKDLLKIKNI
ncbi:hypothetical protein [Clostridium tarantellae]|uniref:Uncharacterized protein n=1 Tax=Clostridium tarantellae TaxID=39493 RepID=A0A6I1MRE8_9CLOT|nr:hypothetical protein [Clostridium tarantellae]MPQ45373.1 hypothetical protein [Clostridium tarantellae]